MGRGNAKFFIVLYTKRAILTLLRANPGKPGDAEPRGYIKQRPYAGAENRRNLHSKKEVTLFYMPVEPPKYQYI